MTTSWTQTCNQIIVRALRLNGAVSFGETPSADVVNQARDSLNSIAQSLQNKGIRLWSLEWDTQTLTASSEVTGTDGKIYTCIRNHTSAAINRPITGADYSTYWVVRGTTGGTWVTGTAYTSINQFSLDTGSIDLETPFVRTDGRNDGSLDVLEWEQYAAITDKTVTGRPARVYVEYTTSVPNVYIWPHPDNTDYVIHFKRVKRLQDFKTDDDIDFPVRWIEYLTFELAYKESFYYNAPYEKKLALKNQAEEERIYAMRNDRESPSSNFVAGAFDSSSYTNLWD